jgi:cellulose synthase/poly-beta-1,6-N-acetylglucosamine synthase-like glycosyltransferase
MPICLTFFLLVFACPPLILLLLDSFLRVWFLLVSRWVPGASETASLPGSIALAVVIPAHNEGEIIEFTLARLQACIPSRDLFVIADNCTDDTAAVARRVGAQVWERRQPDERGKGVALRWFLTVAGGELRAYNTLAIFDADSIVDERFLQNATAALNQGADVVQGFVQPVSGGSPAADLAAYSELLSQHIDDMARTRLGWPVPLRGTGVVFRREVLAALLPHLGTKVEDVEMSLLLAAQDRLVRFAPDAVVGDPKPAAARGVATQRARWLQGQREVLGRHGRLVLRLLFSGRPGNVSLVFATLLKPKTLLLLLKVLWLILALRLPQSQPGLYWGAVALAGLALSADLVYYLLGLRRVERPGRYARALVQAPFYLTMWLWSLILSVISTHPWLSVRRNH